MNISWSRDGSHAWAELLGEGGGVSGGAAVAAANARLTFRTLQANVRLQSDRFLERFQIWNVDRRSFFPHRDARV